MVRRRNRWLVHSSPGTRSRSNPTLVQRSISFRNTVHLVDMARVRRSWTSKEDELLRQAVMTGKALHYSSQCSSRLLPPPSRNSDRAVTDSHVIPSAEQQHQPLRWRELAKAVPGRSNKDCRRRWWNSLADGRTMGLWSEHEDELLIAAIQRWGTNWTKVAAEVGSRSADQCSSHWNHVLDPKINYCDWTPEEVC